MEVQKEWVWASRPGKSFGKVEVYKRYLTEREVKNKKISKDNDTIKGVIENYKLPVVQRSAWKEKITEHSGIYLIVCDNEKHVYVGQSKNVDVRLRSHKKLIQSTATSNTRAYIKIKEHYKKHGIDAFQFINHIKMPQAKIGELLAKESETMIEYARNGYILYNISVNISEGAGTIYCPAEFQQEINTLVKLLTKDNICKLNEFIYAIQQQQALCDPQVQSNA